MSYCSSSRIDYLINRTQGAVQVRVRNTVDNDWYECMDAKYVSLNRANTKHAIYSRRGEVALMPGAYQWRDRKGRIAVAPEDDAHSRDCQFISVPYATTLGEVFDAAEELEAHEDGRLWRLDLRAEVLLNDRAIGDFWLNTGSVDGSRDSDHYVQSCAREAAHEAVAEARRWLSKARQPVAPFARPTECSRCQGTFSLMRCIECAIVLCPNCNAFGHDCEVNNG